MRLSKKKARVIFFVMLLITLAVILGVSIICFSFFRLTPERFLCNMNYPKVLQSCRELSKQVASGDLRPGTYQIRFNVHPLSSRFPKPILELKPSYVFIDKDGRIMIEMLGGIFGHFGVNAYPENYKEPYPGFKYSDIKIIDGLWYYDDECWKNPKHKKKIEALIEKQKKK